MPHASDELPHGRTRLPTQVWKLWVCFFSSANFSVRLSIRLTDRPMASPSPVAAAQWMTCCYNQTAWEQMIPIGDVTSSSSNNNNTTQPLVILMKVVWWSKTTTTKTKQKNKTKHKLVLLLKICTEWKIILIWASRISVKGPVCSIWLDLMCVCVLVALVLYSFWKNVELELHPYF